MKSVTIPQFDVITADNPYVFKELLNSRIRELAQYEPEVVEKTIDGSEYRAMIQWTETESVGLDSRFFSVREEFHDEGIRFICGECPLHDIEPDKRRKRVSCKYSESGVTHLEHECCEYFYKLLKQNRITPIVPEPDEPGMNKVKGTVR